MVERGRASIVNIVHIYSFERGSPSFAHSGAARAGVVNLTSRSPITGPAVASTSTRSRPAPSRPAACARRSSRTPSPPTTSRSRSATFAPTPGPGRRSGCHHAVCLLARRRATSMARRSWPTAATTSTADGHARPRGHRASGAASRPFALRPTRNLDRSPHTRLSRASIPPRAHRPRRARSPPRPSSAAAADAAVAADQFFDSTASRSTTASGATASPSRWCTASPPRSTPTGCSPASSTSWTTISR